MKNFLKNNILVLTAFLLPSILIVVLTLAVYVPTLFVSTQYNFVYMSCAIDGTPSFRHDCGSHFSNQYDIVNGRLEAQSIAPGAGLDGDGVSDSTEQYTFKFFFYDTTHGESREISFEEVRSLTLSELITSPDGVAVSSHYDRGMDSFMFAGGPTHGYYLTKGEVRQKLHLRNAENHHSYTQNFQFIGWVLPDKQ